MARHGDSRSGETWRSLPLPYWLLPLASGAAAVVVWTVWCDNPDLTWVGGALVAATGLLVHSLVLEALPHHSGFRALVRRSLVAALAGMAAAIAALIAAGIGFYLRCPLF